PLLVKHFGTELGTIVLDMDDIDIADNHIPKEYCWSGLNSNNYNRYNRDQFIDTLEDWGWYGDETKRPAWYTGKYYKKKE
ncbi:MAG: hypothetical protein GY705_16915, partial [Bacteroidetes bacterium]|nr:hypothetical protein [Bacteroidota bacterium]